MARTILAVALAAAVSACGGSKPPPAPPKVANTAPATAPAPDPIGGAGYGGAGYGGDAYGGDRYGLVEYDNAPLPAVQEGLNVTGLWVSDCMPGDGKGQFAQLRYDLTATTWDFRADVFADTACSKRKSSFHMTGGYKVGARSATVAGAFETTATYTSRDLTADDKKTAAALGKACGVKLRAGVATDIHAKGCARLDAPPAAKLCEEHDLVAIDNGALRSGDRKAGADLCGPDKRPTALSTRALVARWKPVGLGDCDAIGAEYEKLATCAAIPADQRPSLRDAMRLVNQSLINEAARQSPGTADACKAAIGQLVASVKNMGC